MNHRRWLAWFRSWGPALLWMGGIFVLSAQPTLPGFPNPWKDLLLKKGGHATAYAVLALLYWRALMLAGRSRRAAAPVAPDRWRRTALWLAWGLALLYAATDEWHQAYVPGRHARVTDWLIDALGAGLALLAAWRWGQRWFPARPTTQSESPQTDVPASLPPPAA